MHDATACNFDADATVANNTDCTYPASAFEDCEGNCVNDNDGDDVRDEEEVFGCTDADASNYNPWRRKTTGHVISPTRRMRCLCLQLRSGSGLLPPRKLRF